VRRSAFAPMVASIKARAKLPSNVSFAI
jgi:hypothetical protein